MKPILRGLFPLTKEKKMILIAGVVALTLAAVYHFYPDIQALFIVSDEMALNQKQVKTYAAIAARRPQIEKENIYWKRLLKETESRLLSGVTPSLAAVEIQNILNTIAVANKVEFVSMRVMKPESDEGSGFIRLPVQFSINCTIAQLKDIVYKIEVNPKLLVIKEITSNASRDKSQAMIQSTIKVEGVMRALDTKEKPKRKKAE